MSKAFSPEPRPNIPTPAAADPSPHLPAAPVLDGDTLSRLTEGRGAVPIVIGGRDPGTLQRVTDGYLLKTERLTVHLDTAGACTRFTDPAGREASRRFIGGELLLERLQRWGIASTTDQEQASPGVAMTAPPRQGTVVPAVFTPLPTRGGFNSPENTPDAGSPSPGQSVMQIAAISRDTPSLLAKGVSASRINEFMTLARTVFDRFGVPLNQAQLAALTGACLQENALSTAWTSGGRGICQWTADRARNFDGFFSQYRQRYNPNASVTEGQLAYIIHEMKGIEGIRGNGAGSEHARGCSAFLRATSLNDALRGMKDYLRYGEPGKRYHFGKEIYGMLSQPEQTIT